MKCLLLLLLLVGCEGAGVSYHVGVSHGVSNFDTPVREFATNTIYFGVGFAPFQAAAFKSAEDAELRRANREERMEFLANESAKREEHIEVLTEASLMLHAPGANFDSVIAGLQDDAPEDAEMALDLGDITTKPETLNEAYILAIWIVAICLLLLTLKQVGILNWALRIATKPKDEEPR